MYVAWCGSWSAMSQRRRMSIAIGDTSFSSPSLGLGAHPALEATAEEVEELEQRVAELEEELEETRTNLETASSIGQQMVERLQQIEEENEELRVGNMAPDAIHESEIVRPVHTHACPESVQLTLPSLPFAGQPERHVARGPR